MGVGGWRKEFKKKWKGVKSSSKERRRSRISERVKIKRREEGMKRATGKSGRKIGEGNGK